MEYHAKLKHIREEDEMEWIRRLKNDDVLAFEAMYYRYSGYLFNYCLEFTKSKENAEELVQDVFLKLWNFRKEIRTEQSMKGLLFTIARTRLLNSLSKNVRMVVYNDALEQIDCASDDATDREVEYNEFVGRLNRAMNRLPAKQREIIRLSKIHHFTNRQIAEKLSLSEQTVKNQLSLGLKLLKRIVLLFIWNLINT